MTKKNVENQTDVQQNTPTGTQSVPFEIFTQYIKDQSFENPNPIASFLTPQQNQLNVSVDYITAKADKIKDGVFEVVLSIRVKGQISEEITSFIAELSYGALVGIDTSKVPQESLNPIIMIHFPTLLFPFARAIISNMTRDGGFPALMLPLVDFASLYQEQVERQKKAS